MREIKFRFFGEFGELNEETDKCDLSMLYGDVFCFFNLEPINELFADKTITEQSENTQQTIKNLFE